MAEQVQTQAVSGAQAFGHSPDDPMFRNAMISVPGITSATLPAVSPASETPEATVEQTEATATETTEQPTAVQLSSDTLVIDPRDGQQKPWSQIDGERQLKSEHDRRLYELAQREKTVEQYAPYIDTLQKVSKSPVGSVVFASIAQGASDEATLNAAAAVAGRSMQAPVDTDPEPPKPNDSLDKASEEYASQFLAHLSWESRQQAKETTQKMIEPIVERNKQLEAEIAELRTAGSRESEAQQAIRTANGASVEQIVNSIYPNYMSMNAEQKKQIAVHIDATADSLGLLQKSQREVLSPMDLIKLTAALPRTQSQPVPEPAKAIPPARETPKKQPLQPGQGSGFVLQSNGTPNPEDGMSSAEIFKLMENISGRGQ